MQLACAVALWGASVMCWQGCRPPAATQSKAVMKEMAFDLMDAWVVQEMLQWAAQGLIDVLLGGPPCATWSAARHLPGGPPPLRERGAMAWGFPHLVGAAAEQCS